MSKKSNKFNNQTTSNASITVPRSALHRPKGMPKKKWNSLSNKAKARFLDFSISTASYNSGTQQFGAGQSMRSRSRDMEQGDFSGDVAASPIVHYNSSHQSHAKWVTFSETELVRTVNGSVAYSVVQIPINPGLDSFAAIGSGVMQKFERYIMRKLNVKFIPTVSGYAAAGQTGRIVLGVMYDAASEAPADLRAAEGNVPNAPGFTSDNIVLSVSADKVERYTRSDRNPAGTDLKTYDPGFIYVAVEGTPSAAQVGEIHVEYEFSLRNVLDAPSPLPRNLVILRAFQGPYSVSAGTNNLTFSYAGGASSATTMNGLGAQLVSYTPAGGAAGTYFKLPLGRYLVHVKVQYSPGGGYCNDLALWAAQNGPAASIANFPVVGSRQNDSAAGYGAYNTMDFLDAIEVTDPATNGIVVPTCVLGSTATGTVWVQLIIQVA